MYLRAIQILASVLRKYDFKGKERILRLLYHPDMITDTTRIRIIMPYLDTLKIHIDTQIFLEWSIFFYSAYEKNTIKVLKAILSQASNVVEVGANVGAHTIAIAEACPQGKIIAVEPYFAARARLESNIALNSLSNIIVIDTALSDKEGESVLHCPTLANQANASLYRDHIDRTEKVNSFPVHINTVDRVFETSGLIGLDLIKMDVEGNDFHVIQGARQTIDRFHPFLIFEFERTSWSLAGDDFPKVHSFLFERGYTLYQFSERYFQRIKGMNIKEFTNVLAIPSDRHFADTLLLKWMQSSKAE